VPIVAGDQQATIPLQPTPGSVYLTLLVSMFVPATFSRLRP
jgi:hypothetical protein